MIKLTNFFMKKIQALFHFSSTRSIKTLHENDLWRTFREIFYSIRNVSELQCLVNSKRPNPGQSEKINLNFYFNAAFRNERVFKGWRFRWYLESSMFINASLPQIYFFNAVDRGIGHEKNTFSLIPFISFFLKNCYGWVT